MADGPAGPDRSRGADTRVYTELQTRAWLGWLARNLKEHGESIFLIERLQPSWLEHRRHRVFHFVAFSVLLGVVLGIVLHAAWLVSEEIAPSGQTHTWLEWVTLTPLWLLLVGGIERLLRAVWPHRPGGRTLGAGYRLVEGLIDYIAWLLMFLALWRLMPSTAAGAADPMWMLHPVLGGFILVFLYEVRVRILADPREIQAVEALGRSKRRAVFGLLVGTGGALVLWGILVAIVGEEPKRNFLVYVPLGMVGGALVGFFKPRMLEKTAEPNQGIRLSLRHALIAAVVAILVLGVIFGGAIHLPVPWGFPERSDPFSRLKATLLLTPVLGVAAFLWYGGLAALRHWFLRVLLVAEGKPLSLRPFLDHATRLHFLQRVGGGYLFVHRYLLEHFADTENDSAGGDPSVELSG